MCYFSLSLPFLIISNQNNNNLNPNNIFQNTIKSKPFSLKISLQLRFSSHFSLPFSLFFVIFLNSIFLNNLRNSFTRIFVLWLSLHQKWIQIILSIYYWNPFKTRSDVWNYFFIFESKILFWIQIINIRFKELLTLYQNYSYDYSIRQNVVNKHDPNLGPHHQHHCQHSVIHHYYHHHDHHAAFTPWSKGTRKGETR